MNGDSKSFSESLVLGDTEDGVIVKGITDATVAAKSGLQAGDEIVAATIQLDNLNKTEVLSILRVLEPYEGNMKVLTKKDLFASNSPGSLGLEMLQGGKDLSLGTSANTPSVSIDDLSGNINATKALGSTISGPTLNGDIPSLSLNNPLSDIDGTITVPSSELTGPGLKSDLGSFTVPNVSTCQLNTSDTLLDIEKPEVKTGHIKAQKFSMPNFNLPQIRTGQPKVDASAYADLPSVSGNIGEQDLKISTPQCEFPDVDLNGPIVDLDTPGLNVETPNADVKADAGHFKLPNINWKGPKVKKPDANLQADVSVPDAGLSTPKIVGEVCAPDFDINSPKADIKGPELDVQTPDLEIHKQSHKINWPHLKWGRTKVPKADLDVDANLHPTEVSVPIVEGGVNVPEVDFQNVDVQGLDLDVQAPKIDASTDYIWPHQKWKLRRPKADMNADFNTPDPNLSGLNVEGGINGPSGEFSLPNADLDVQTPNITAEPPSGKSHWRPLKWKKPKLHTPKADLNVDPSLPSAEIDGDISTPDVDITLPQPIDPPSGKVRFPTLKRPKFGFSGPKVKGPEVDVDADVKAPDFSVSPNASFDVADVDMDLPNANVDVQAPNANIKTPSGIKFPTLKKPKWLVSAPKVNGPDFEADVSAPDLNLSPAKIDMPDASVNLPNAEVECPKLDVNGPDVDVDIPSGKSRWFKLPKFGTLKGPKADIDTNVKAVDVDFSAPDASLSTPQIDGVIDTPDLDVNIPDVDIKGPSGDLKGPDVDIEGTNANWKLPKLKLPKLKGPKAKSTEFDADVKAPDIDASRNVPKVAVNTPDLDLNATDLSYPVPKFEGGFDVPDLIGPDVDVQAPDIDASIEKPKLPSLNLPKVDHDFNWKTPNLNLSPPKIDGSVSTPKIDTQLPKADLGVSDVDMNLTDAGLQLPDFDSSLGELKMPHFSHPKLDFSSPKVDIPSVDPTVEGGLEAPRVNIGTPSADANISAPNVDLNLPGGDIKGPKVDVKAPHVDGNVEKPRLPHFKFPKFGLSKPKSPEINAEADLECGSGVDSDNDVPNADVEVPLFKLHRLPRASIDCFGGLGDAFEIARPDIGEKDYIVSKGVVLPVVNTTSKGAEKIDIMERLKMAKEKISSANATPTDDRTDIDLSFGAPNFDVNASSAAGDLVRGGTFKVEKPESTLGLVAPEISTSDENDKFSLGLSNMLGLK